MILTCPQCSARFQLSAEILSPDGKRVRCSACHESWFELPDRDELQVEKEENHVPLEDIPDGVKPIPEGSNVPVLTEPDEPTGELKPETIKVLVGGLAMMLLFFVIVFLGVLAAKQSILKVWPESYVFYDAVGLIDHVPGQGLIFDKVSATQSNGHYVIEGHVINLTSSQRAVPLMKAFLVTKDDKIVESWMIEPPVRKIAKEQTIAFRAEYTSQNQGEHHAPLGVVLKFVFR